jgi:plasmid stabilization system protein ParE
MMTVEFLREAEVELREAIVHYEETASGLGLDFQRQVKRAVEHIAVFPNAWSPRDDGTRRHLLRQFPYLVLYVVHDDRVWILGVAGCRQQPRGWNPLIGKAARRK